MMGRWVDRKNLIPKVWVGVRKLLGLALVLEGLVSLLVYDFGGGRSIWGIDGLRIPNWQVDLNFTLMLWPIAAPFWLALFCLALGGFWSVLFGRRWLVWALRIISIPMGALAAWSLDIVLTSGNGNTFDKLEWLSVLALAVAPWIIPIQRRKLSQAADGTAPDAGGASSWFSRFRRRCFRM